MRWGTRIMLLACFLVASSTAILLAVAVQVPYPPNAGFTAVIERALHALVAEIDVRLFSAQRKVDGAREMLALDPSLHGIGRRGASKLAQNSGVPLAERVDAASRLLAADASTWPTLGSLLEPAAFEADKSILSRALTGLGTAASPARDHLAPQALRAVLAAQRDDAIEAIVVLGEGVQESVREEMAAVIAYHDNTVRERLGDARAGELAMRLARIPASLNLRAIAYDAEGLHDKAVPLYEEALQKDKDPDNVIIAANWAVSSKRLAVCRHDDSRFEQYDRLLDAGIAARPDVAIYRDARAWNVAYWGCN